MDCTPSSLSAAARCFSCIPPGMVPAVKTMLLAKWAGCGGSPALNCIALTGAGTAAVNQTYQPVSAAEYDGVGYQIAFDSVDNLWQVLSGSGGFGSPYYTGIPGNAPTGPFAAFVGASPDPTGAFVACP
jgi:hypothetical protein